MYIRCIIVVIGYIVQRSLVVSKYVKFNDDLVTSHNSLAKISFHNEENESIPDELLMTVDGYYGDKNDRIDCSQQEDSVNHGHVTILLALSNCLSDKTIHVIEEWVEHVKKDAIQLIKDGKPKFLKFSSTIVPGDCDQHQNYSYEHGNGFFDRIHGFKMYGKILPNLEASIHEHKDENPIAVLSFVNDAKAYESILAFEKKHRIVNIFNFHICQEFPGLNTCYIHEFRSAIQLQASDDIYKYNPFVVARQFFCPRLEGGVPVSTTDSAGQLECFCTCPIDTTMEQKNEASTYGTGKTYYCKKSGDDSETCSWNVHPFGFQHQVTAPLQMCTLDHISTIWGVPVPFPRLQSAHAKAKASSPGVEVPFISLSSKRIESEMYFHESLQHLYTLTHTGVVVKEDEKALPPRKEDLFNEFGMGDITNLVGVNSDSKLDKDNNSNQHEFKYTWRDYQLHRKDAIDSLHFTSYGKYELTLLAQDYNEQATCKGCIAVVDYFRPRHTTVCPKAFQDTSFKGTHEVDNITASLTPLSLQNAHRLVQSVYEYGKLAENDACSIQNRCDEVKFRIKDFFTSSYDSTKPFHSGKECFNPKKTISDFLKSPQLKANPLIVKKPIDKVVSSLDDCEVSQDDVPITPNGLCTRCCNYSIALREYWVDYTCGYEYDILQCDGLPSEQCAFEQCLNFQSKDFAYASVVIRRNVILESKRVLKTIMNQGYDAYTQIHRKLNCQDFNHEDPVCAYSASIIDIFEITTKSQLSMINDQSIDDMVFWRYKVDSDDHGWQGFHPSQKNADKILKFTSPSSDIYIEVYTQCGLLRVFKFTVHLHVTSTIQICDSFNLMWYQSTNSRLMNSPTICSYPLSDFAELTFDFHPNMMFAADQKSTTQEKLEIKVECNMQFENREAAEIFFFQGDAQDLVQRFAIELLHLQKTQSTTRFRLQCHFAYSTHLNKHAEQTCEQFYTIEDCQKPYIDSTHYASCMFDDCAGTQFPGPYQACGGNVVKATSTQTYMDDEDIECCQSCGTTETLCMPLLQLPHAKNEIKRCVPPWDKYVQMYPTEIYPIENAAEYTEYRGKFYITDNQNYGFETENDTKDGPIDDFSFMEYFAAADVNEWKVTLFAITFGSLCATTMFLVYKKRNGSNLQGAIINDAYVPLLE